MKIALAQINTTVGDFDGNLRKIVAALDRARAATVDLVVFPEQTIPGYPAEDLLERNDFLEAIELTFDQAVRASRGVAMVLGTVVRAAGPGGNALHNSAVLVDDGRVVGLQHKTLLPTYDVFDEDRYFRPAESYTGWTFRGRRVGLLICEDLWNDAGFWPRPLYSVDPAEKLLGGSDIDVLLAISASPFSVGRPRFRYAMLRHTAMRYGVDLVYCNLVGGNTSLVFDGASLALDPRGRVRKHSVPFAEEFTIFDLDEPASPDLPERLRGVPDGPLPERVVRIDDRDLEEIHGALVLGTRDYLQKSGFQSAVVGLSGGIDSAVTAAIATEAIGKENLLGVAMPSRYSSDGSVRDAERLAGNLGIELKKIPIESIFGATLETLRPHFEGRPEDVTEENLQARIRGNILMAFSNKLGALLLTTGNKSELAVGYCTLYGDMSGGLAVISDVPKTLVYRLARWINRQGEVIPRETIEKPPSAELRPDQRDQDTLPPYDVLDPIIESYVEERKAPEEIAASGFDEETVRRVIVLIDKSEYKRKQAAPGLRITSKAFGRGRRFPVVEKFRR